jgi:uncharacterized RDD family membrane protein YckC
MANQWYYARNNQQAGPVTFEQLQHLAVTGGLIGTDLVWTEGMSAWTPAATTPGLFAAPGGAAPAGSNFATPYSTQMGGMPAAQVPYGGPQQPGPQFLGYYSQMGAFNYAGFWIRLLAYIIDTVIVTVASFVVGFVFGVVMGALRVDPDVIRMFGALIGGAIGILYYPLMESSAAQATFGKTALGLKVVDMNGARISVGRAFGRWAGKILSGLILCIGYIMIAFSDKKQGLHDQMASTLVVYK